MGNKKSGTPGQGERSVVLGLIEADIKNVCLVSGLESMHIFADDYRLDLARLIFRLTGFREETIDEDLFTVYDGFISEMPQLDVTDTKSIRQIAGILYDVLVKEKEKRDQ